MAQRKSKSARATKPGLAKARTLPTLVERTLRLVLSSDHRVQELFDTADIMSEGDTWHDRGESTYYGTTSVLLKTTHGSDVDSLSSVLHLDPHARTRAVRIACREASVRCGKELSQVRAEVAVRMTAHGVRFDVEVEAPLGAQQDNPDVGYGVR